MKYRYQISTFVFLILSLSACQTENEIQILVLKNDIDSKYAAFVELEFIIKKVSSNDVQAAIHNIVPLHQGGIDKLYWNYKNYVQEIDLKIGTNILIKSEYNFKVNDSISTILSCYGSDCVLKKKH